MGHFNTTFKKSFSFCATGNRFNKKSYWGPVFMAIGTAGIQAEATRTNTFPNPAF